MSMALTVSILALLAWRSAEARASAGAVDPPKFNNTKCPAYWELQAPHVAGELRTQDLQGFFYELAFHDYTQYPMCPFNPRCINSSKSVGVHQDGVRFVNDTWGLNCAGVRYPQELLFNITEHPGELRGYWPHANVPFLPASAFGKLVFPDTVVDFKAGPQGWLLEFQCVEFKHHVVFVGINFYAKDKDEDTFKEMEAAARARGLGFWMYRGFGLKRVDHSQCTSQQTLRSDLIV